MFEHFIDELKGAKEYIRLAHESPSDYKHAYLKMAEDEKNHARWLHSTYPEIQQHIDTKLADAKEFQELLHLIKD